MDSCEYDDRDKIDDSKRNEMLDKIGGMSWKRNQNSQSRLRKNVQERSDTEIGYNNEPRRDFTKYRFEVYIRETYPYIDEVPDSEISNDSEASPHTSSSLFKRENYMPVNNYFFKNIHPKDKNAFKFYKPEKISAALDTLFAVEQPKFSLLNAAVCNPSRKPWLSILASQSDKAKFSDVSKDQLSADSQIILKRKPGTGIRLNCKRSEIPLNESEKRSEISSNESEQCSAIPANVSEQVQCKILADSSKKLRGDIEILLNHIDAERLNNLNQNTDKKTHLERNTSGNEFQKQYLSNCEPLTIDVTNSVLMKKKFDGKQKDVHFPTAMVQPSVMISPSKQLQEPKMNTVNNSCWTPKLLDSQNQISESSLPACINRNTAMKNVDDIPMFSNDLLQENWNSHAPKTLHSQSQMPAFVPKMAEQQNQISQYSMTTSSHEMLNSLNYLPIHANRSLQS